MTPLLFRIQLAVWIASCQFLGGGLFGFTAAIAVHRLGGRMVPVQLGMAVIGAVLAAMVGLQLAQRIWPAVKECRLVFVVAMATGGFLVGLILARASTYAYDDDLLQAVLIWSGSFMGTLFAARRRLSIA